MTRFTVTSENVFEYYTVAEVDTIQEALASIEAEKKENPFPANFYIIDNTTNKEIVKF